MITMHVPKILALTENVLMHQSQFQLQKTNVKFLHVVPRLDSILIQRTATIAILAPKILAILPEIAYIKERAAMITTNAQTISAMWQPELALIPLLFALILIFAQRILAMQNLAASTPLNSICQHSLRATNATLILVIPEPET